MTTAAEAPTVEKKARHLERCRVCSSMLPESRVCTRCGTEKKTPRHEKWPRSLKVFLLMKAAERLFFFSWRPMQESWELLLTTHFQNRSGAEVIPRSSTAPDDVYDRAVKEADEWKAAGGETSFL